MRTLAAIIEEQLDIKGPQIRALTQRAAYEDEIADCLAIPCPDLTYREVRTAIELGQGLKPTTTPPIRG